MSKKCKNVIVDWDTDGEEIKGLRDVVEVPCGLDDEEVADYLSNEYGFCVNSWTYVQDFITEYLLNNS